MKKRYYGSWETFRRCSGCGMISRSNIYDVCPVCGSPAPSMGRPGIIGRRVTEGFWRSYIGLEVKLLNGGTMLCMTDGVLAELIKNKSLELTF